MQSYIRNIKDYLGITPAVVVAGAILALCTQWGMSLSQYHDFSGLTQSPAITAAIFIVLWAAFTIAAGLATHMLQSSQWNHIAIPCPALLRRHPQTLCVLFLFIVWLLQEMVFLPGSVPFDGTKQLDMYFGVIAATDQHPWLATQLMGTVLSLGVALFGKNGGCLFYVLLQNLLGALVFGKLCAYTRKRTRSDFFCLLTLLFFGINPVWWASMQAVLKDSAFIIAFAWTMLQIIKIALADDTLATKIQLPIAAILACLMRHDALYVLLPGLVVLAFLQRKKLKVIVAASILLIVFSFVSHNVTATANLDSHNPFEPYSIPVQQVARCVVEHGEELTEEEVAAIDAILVYDEIADVYDPELCDPVKSLYRVGTQDAMPGFLKTWTQLVKRYPLTCLEATANNMFGYTYPAYTYIGRAKYNLYTAESQAGGTYSTYWFDEEARTKAIAIADGWDRVPIISLLTSPGFYPWVLLVAFCGLRKDKRKLRWLFVVPFLSLCVCFASPVNSLMRYAMPLLAVCPLYVMLAVPCANHCSTNKQ